MIFGVGIPKRKRPPVHMFDWIFFGIMIPVPALLALDLYLNREGAQREKSALARGGRA